MGLELVGAEAMRTLGRGPRRATGAPSRDAAKSDASNIQSQPCFGCQFPNVRDLDWKDASNGARKSPMLPRGTLPMRPAGER